MAQTPASNVYKNVLPWRGCEKLYLDARTADVFFVFESDDEDTVKIPAHKNILSANSEAFDAMFYGPAKQEGDIPIVDSTPDVFTEFLQFFYLATVKLTVENAANVWNLGKQYLVDDCCMASSNISEQTLTLDNVCWNYEMAILFDQAHLMKICEQKISENPKEIFQSNSFLSCGRNVLARILQLESLNCDESVVFDGCIAWAEAACMQKGLDEANMQNLRNQLGDLFYEIRFGEMTTENFFVRYRAYEKLFTTKEFKDIFGMIATKDYRPLKFNRSARKASPKLDKNKSQLICNRNDPFACLDHKAYIIDSDGSHTVFSSNRALLLKAIVCGKLFHYRHFPHSGEWYHKTGVFSINTIPTVIKVIELSNARIITNQYNEERYLEWDKNTIYSDEMVLRSTQETIVNFPTPIIIHPGTKYEILFTLLFDGCYTLMTLKSKVQLERDIEIEFHKIDQYNLHYDVNKIKSTDDQGLVRQLIFEKSEDFAQK